MPDFYLGGMLGRPRVYHHRTTPNLIRSTNGAFERAVRLYGA